jgi:CubicO group peptidase (beta-lactamase class C family)
VPASPPPDLTAAAVRSAGDYWDRWLGFRQHFQRVPGVQAALWYSDGFALSTAHGLADVESGAALTTAHLFRIASHSKTFTATAVLRLVEESRLRLDDPVGAWLGWLNATPLGDRTVRELLAHGGGVVRDGHDGDFWQLSRPFPNEAALRDVATDRADVFPANHQFKYSNVGYGLLGLVVAAASGVTYGEYVQREVVDRLGLERTGPELDPARNGEYATGYSSLTYADTRIPVDQVDTGALAAATGFYSTAEDLCRYASAHFLGDERLLRDRSKRLLQREEWKVEGADTHYGLGFGVHDVGGRRLVGHGGGYPGHITRTLLDPVAGVAVSVLTNAIDGPALEMASAAVRLADLAAAHPDVPAGLAPAALDRFCGRYAQLWGVLDVVRLGGRLYAIDPSTADPADEPTELEVTGAMTARIARGAGFGSPGETLHFDVADDGTVRGMRGNGGLSWYPFDAFRQAVAERDRVRLGEPVRPAAASAGA